MILLSLKKIIKLLHIFYPSLCKSVKYNLSPIDNFFANMV